MTRLSPQSPDYVEGFEVHIRLGVTGEQLVELTEADALRVRKDDEHTLGRAA